MRPARERPPGLNLPGRSGDGGPGGAANPLHHGGISPSPPPAVPGAGKPGCSSWRGSTACPPGRQPTSSSGRHMENGDQLCSGNRRGGLYRRQLSLLLAAAAARGAHPQPGPLTDADNPEILIGFAGHSRYLLVRGDIADRDLVQDLFSRYPYHQGGAFAAESTWTGRSWTRCSLCAPTWSGPSSCWSARQAWKDLAGPQAPRFLHVSTDEAYGSGPDDPPVTEAAPYAPGAPMPLPRPAPTFWSRRFPHLPVAVLITNCSNNYGPYQFPEKLIPFCLSRPWEVSPSPSIARGPTSGTGSLWRTIARR